MNFLPSDKQIEVVSALTEGFHGIRATARIAGVNRETVAKFALQVGKGCAELMTAAWSASASTGSN